MTTATAVMLLRRAEKAEAEVERLRRDRDRIHVHWIDTLAEVERLREAPPHRPRRRVTALPEHAALSETGHPTS